MKPTSTSSAWLEQEYCASVAAALLARNEFFELLEDATVSPALLCRARAAWREHAEHAELLKGLYAAPQRPGARS